MKDDNLGLGAKRGAKADTFGLDTLQGIFGRLNGKSTAVLEEEQKSRRDTGLALYQGDRWGRVQFVSGGFLVGDEIERKRPVAHATDGPSENKKAVSQEASKKRKRLEVSTLDRASQEKLSRKSRKEGKVDADRTKDQLRKSLSSMATDVAHNSATHDPVAKQTKDQDVPCETERLVKRKRQKVPREARTKEEKRKAKALREPKLSLEPDSAALQNEAIDGDSVIKSAIAEPVEAQSSNAPFGRHAVRSKYIRQKRMAMMDAKALNEVSCRCTQKLICTRTNGFSQILMINAPG